MTRERLIRLLGYVLGIGFIVFGLIETTVALDGGDSIAFFWFPALCGGGTAILLGLFKLRAHQRLSTALVVLGCLSGGLAMAWTLLVPLLAILLIVLILSRSQPDAAATAGS